MMDVLCYLSLPLILGWLFDKLLGDPTWLPHPIVGFGKLIAWGESFLNKGKYRIFKGAMLTVFLVSSILSISFLLLLITFKISIYLYIAIASILVFYSLAGTTLMREVKQVFIEVDYSLEKGRKQVSRIVGRDTSTLTAQDVRRAALETLAENLSDGVIAPIFWYLILGVPGILAYKMINTLDSMIGYRNERYLLFGRFAAKLDDVANYVPARLTSWLMIAVSNRLDLYKFINRYGIAHLSPNSGYPEAALAGILDCRFGGTHDYFGQSVYKPYIGENERLLTTSDMKKAIRINQRTEAAMMLIILTIHLFVQFY